MALHIPLESAVGLIYSRQGVQWQTEEASDRLNIFGQCWTLQKLGRR